MNEPWLTVLQGRPTDEELAALMAVLAGLGAQVATSDAHPPLATTATLRRTGRALVGRDKGWETLTPRWSRPRRAVPARVRAPAHPARVSRIAAEA